MKISKPIVASICSVHSIKSCVPMDEVDAADEKDDGRMTIFFHEGIVPVLH
jgi:hypothetical protein